MLKKLVLAVFILPSLFACESKDKVPSSENNISEVLVKVNGQPITQTDLDTTTEKVLSSGVASLYANEIREKALESMVMMMAIAQESEKKASAEELATIESKTQRYREELLTELYMRKFADVQPPTESQIAQYYEKNKTLFGEKKIKQFEMVRSREKPKGETLQSQLAQLNKLNAEQWTALKKQMEKLNDDFEVVATTTDIANLDKNLLRVVNSLDENEVSKVVFLNEKPHVIKVIKVTTQNAAPLTQVRPQIRKALAAQKLKQHIKEISADLLTDANVQYTESAN